MIMSRSSWGLDLSKYSLRGQRNLKALHQTVMLPLFPSLQSGHKQLLYIKNSWKTQRIFLGSYKIRLMNYLDLGIKTFCKTKINATLQQCKRKVRNFSVKLKTCPLESRAPQQPQHSPNLHGNGVHRGPTKITHS